MLARRRLSGTCLLCSLQQLQRISLRRSAAVARRNGCLTSAKDLRQFTTTAAAKNESSNSNGNDVSKDKSDKNYTERARVARFVRLTQQAREESPMKKATGSSRLHLSPEEKLERLRRYETWKFRQDQEKLERLRRHKHRQFRLDQEKLDIMRSLRSGRPVDEQTVSFEDIVSRLELNTAEKKEQLARRDGTRSSLPDVSGLSPGEAREAVVKATRSAWGAEMPENLLTEEEMQLYKALYGSPERVLNAEEVQKRRMGEPLEGEEVEVDEVLQAEEIYAADPRLPRPKTPEIQGMQEEEEGGEDQLTKERDSDKVLSKHSHSMAENDWIEEEDEHAAERLGGKPQGDDKTKPMAAASILGTVENILAEREAMAEEDAALDDEYFDEESEIRTHPLTLSGRFSTDPSSVSIPRPIVEATMDILRDRNNRHLKEAAEKVGPASTSANLQKRRDNLPSPLNPSQLRMSPMDADVFLTTVFPQQFAKSMATLVEVRRRLGGDWVRGVKKFLDVGTGGAAAKAWEEVVYAESIAQGWKKGQATEPAAESQGSAHIHAKQEKLASKMSASNTNEQVKEADTTSSSSSTQTTDEAPAKESLQRNGSTTPTDKNTEQVSPPVADAKSEEEPWDWGYGIEGLPNSRGYTTTVVAGSDTLQRNISTFMENTLFLPRLPQYVLKEGLDVDPDWEESQRHHAKRSYDLIVASDTIFREGPSHKQKFHVDNLWSLLNPDGGVLVLIEHGSREGFSAIGGARAHLLKRKLKHPEGEGIEHVLTIHEQERAEAIAAEKSDGMIIAPCTNHGDCPLWNTVRGELVLKGKNNFCSVNQRFIKPSYLLNLSNRRDQNHQDVQFSYVAIRKGNNRYRPTPENPAPKGISVNSEWQKFVNFDGPPTRVSRRVYRALKEGYSPFRNKDDAAVPEEERSKKEYSAAELRTYMLTMPRSILPPLKRKGHVHMDVCTPEGKLERWSVPRSYSNEAYHDARKSSWGDLWPLGAKTRTPRMFGHKDPAAARLIMEEEKLPRRVREKELVEEYEDRNKKHIIDMTKGDEIVEPTKERIKERNAEDFSKNKGKMIAQENRDRKAMKRGPKHSKLDWETREARFRARKRKQYDAEMRDDTFTYF